MCQYFQKAHTKYIRCRGHKLCFLYNGSSAKTYMVNIMNLLLMNSVLRRSMEGHYTPLNEDLTSSVCGTWKNSTFIFFQCRTEWNGILSIFVSSTEKIAEKISFNVLLFVAEAKTIVWRSKNVVLVALWSTGFFKEYF